MFLHELLKFAVDKDTVNIDVIHKEVLPKSIGTVNKYCDTGAFWFFQEILGLDDVIVGIHLLDFL